MAARKSTASQTPRNSKATKPGGNRIKETPPERTRITQIPVWVVTTVREDVQVLLSLTAAERYAEIFGRQMGVSCTVTERLAVIVDQPAKPVSSDVPFGVVIGDRIVEAAVTMDEGLEALKRHGTCHLLRFLCSDIETVKAESQAQRRQRPRMTNPLAKKLAAQYQAPLNAIAYLLGDEIEIHDPFGQTVDDQAPDGMRRATDRECAMAEIDTARRSTIDVRRDIAAQVVDRLTSHAKSLLTAARRVKAAAKAGKIPRPSTRRGKAVSA